jgi:hypothetical protein
VVIDLERPFPGKLDRSSQFWEVKKEFVPVRQKRGSRGGPLVKPAGVRSRIRGSWGRPGSSSVGGLAK